MINKDRIKTSQNLLASELPFIPPDNLKVQLLPFGAIEIKQFNEKDLTYESFITAQITDRDQEGVLVSGLDLTQYLDTPVVGFTHFFDHARGYLPIGGTLELEVINHPKYNVDALWTKNQLIDDKSEFMQTIIKCLQFKPRPVLAESIGFIGHQVSDVIPEGARADWNEARRWFVKSILLEHSLCPVVSNFASTPKLKSYFTENELDLSGINRILFAKKCRCPKTMFIVDQEVKDLMGEEYKPLPNFHACRLRDPADFQDGTFRQMKREHEGKEYSVIMGKLTGEDTMTEQSYRYKKDIWTEADARKHCKSHDGILFEPATESESAECPDCKSNEQKIINGIELIKQTIPQIKVSPELINQIQSAIDELEKLINPDKKSGTFLSSMAEKLNKP